MLCSLSVQSISLTQDMQVSENNKLSAASKPGGAIVFLRDSRAYHMLLNCYFTYLFYVL